MLESFQFLLIYTHKNLYSCPLVCIKHMVCAYYYEQNLTKCFDLCLHDLLVT